MMVRTARLHEKPEHEVRVCVKVMPTPVAAGAEGTFGLLPRNSVLSLALTSVPEVFVPLWVHAPSSDRS